MIEKPVRSIAVRNALPRTPRKGNPRKLLAVLDTLPSGDMTAAEINREIEEVRGDWVPTPSSRGGRRDAADEGISRDCFERLKRTLLSQRRRVCLGYRGKMQQDSRQFNQSVVRFRGEGVVHTAERGCPSGA